MTNMMQLAARDTSFLLANGQEMVPPITKVPKKVGRSAFPLPSTRLAAGVETELHFPGRFAHLFFRLGIPPLGRLQEMWMLRRNMGM